MLLVNCMDLMVEAEMSLRPLGDQNLTWWPDEG